MKNKACILSDDEKARFQNEVYGYYRAHGRDMPWRHTTDPYRILVSEIMLQQTQVERVVDKYSQFLAVFPDFDRLARADLRDVLAVWKGLGYNRRALALKSLAVAVVEKFGGRLPQDKILLTTLPGVGAATAGAILAYAFNIPTVFIETNIRRVFIHWFFADREGVRDADVAPLVEATLDWDNPREWYWALMDYGSMLGRTTENPNRRSAHYQRQPPFRGSDRQIRGAILGALIGESRLSADELSVQLSSDVERMGRVLEGLVKEGLVRETDGYYSVG
jgi:A/G-specific adenine glycosylase